MDELNLIIRAKNGDADAFCQLYDLYRSRLYRYAFYRLGNESDAEDAVSECVLAAWRQIGSLRDEQAFPAWIFRILSGLCARLIRQQIVRRDQISMDAAPAGEEKPLHETVPSGAEPADTWVILREALDELTEDQKELVLLSAVGGLSSKEIAELTGMAPGSVRSSLSRSLTKVRGYFK